MKNNIPLLFFGLLAVLAFIYSRKGGGVQNITFGDIAAGSSTLPGRTSSVIENIMQPVDQWEQVGSRTKAGMPTIIQWKNKVTGAFKDLVAGINP